MPSKEWNNKTYEPGQFFVHKKTPYRGIVLGEIRAEEKNIDEIPNEESSLQLADTSFPYYKVLVHDDDYKHIKTPPTEVVIEDTVNLVENRDSPFKKDFKDTDFKRAWRIRDLPGFDIVRHDEISPFTPFTESFEEGVPLLEAQTENINKLPPLEEYFIHDHVIDYFKSEMINANPAFVKNVVQPKNEVMEEYFKTVLPNELIQVYITEKVEPACEITFTVRYIGFEPESRGVNNFDKTVKRYKPQHWWRLGVRIENLDPDTSLRITNQNLTARTGKDHQQFSGPIQSLKPKLEPFLSNVYQYAWNQPMDHDREEIASCWLRLDGQMISTKDGKLVQDKFMIQIPDARQSIVLDPKEFKDSNSLILD